MSNHPLLFSAPVLGRHPECQRQEIDMDTENTFAITAGIVAIAFFVMIGALVYFDMTSDLERMKACAQVGMQYVRASCVHSGAGQ